MPGLNPICLSQLAEIEDPRIKATIRPSIWHPFMCYYSAGSGGVKACLLFVGKTNGSSDRLVADMDDQSRQVEEGIASALTHSLPLLNVVIRDAAAQTTRPVCCWLSFLCLFLCCCCMHLTHTDTSDAVKQACGMLVALFTLLNAAMSPCFFSVQGLVLIGTAWCELRLAWAYQAKVDWTQAGLRCASKSCHCNRERNFELTSCTGRPLPPGMLTFNADFFHADISMLYPQAMILGSLM